MQNNNKVFSTILGGIIVVILVSLCCCCVLVVAAGWFFSTKSQPFSSTPFVMNPTPFKFNFDNATATPPIVITRVPVANISTDTLVTLLHTSVPANDPYDLGCRLQNICNVPTAMPPQTTPLTVGQKQQFWVSNSESGKNFQITATLMYITPHSYFWAEDGSNVNKTAMKQLMDTFENKIYPTDRAFFGSEWTPGVDGDPHIYIIYSGGIGSHVAGYFNSTDEYNPSARKYSNGHESYVLGSNQDLSNPYTYATLAHEFVHMIQFASDRNDVSWIDEGFAEVGAFLNGYSIGGADAGYAQQPDLQLNTWVDPTDPDFGLHYGESFLYLTYFLDRFGQDASKALTRNPDHDLNSVDSTLKALNITDKITGKPLTADDVFADWAVTNYVLDGSVADGRYIYHNYSDAPRVTATQNISTCPMDSRNYTVHQYGVEYTDINCSGAFTLHFEGANTTSLLPTDPKSGKYAFWSNHGDNSDMTLTRDFDFANTSGPIEMKFSTWYDLETNFDYVYVEASTDNGQHWQILKTPSGTDKDISGNSYGWGYTGKSGGAENAAWINESVDLSTYAGKKVQIRFEYVTDAALNMEGFLLDDVSVSAINYSTDFEKDDGGWQANGFARVENVLPQTYRLELITSGGGQTTVKDIEINPDQTADIPLTLQNGEHATLVVSGTSRYTRDLARYSLSIK